MMYRAALIQDYDEEDLQIDVPDMDFMPESVDLTQESAMVKERMTRIGEILTNLEKMDFDEPIHKNNTLDDDSPTMSPINPDVRLATRKDLGLFFGHQDWNLIMNMMIGFRAGLKK
jgi:hypothetical protein